MRPEVLREAIKRVVANKGASGVDGYKVERLKDEAEVERFIAELQHELRSRSYRPSPVRRVYIDKGNGKKRPLGIPTVKDRILQTAVAMFLLPIWEADQHDNSYAYRPNRRTTQAVDAIKSALFGGRVEVIDADIAGYFDTIPHAGLMRQVARRVSDGSILKLIKMWLRAPISEYDSKTRKTKILPNKRGIPQGGVISPLLANLYLSPLDYAVNGKCKGKPSMIRYADDLVILCRNGQGKELLERLNKWLKAKGLKLNEKKTRLVNAWEEGFNFVGFAITRRESRKGRNYYHVEPGIKSRNRLKAAIREILNVQTRNCDEAQTVKKVNEITRGWAQAFYYGNNCRVFGSMQMYVRQRLRSWLWRRHSKKRGRYTHYTNERLHGRYGLWKWPTKAAWAAA
jgi:group II intron reverse transcriptase/maturase